MPCCFTPSPWWTCTGVKISFGNPQRPWRAVPWPWLALLAAALLGQGLWKAWEPPAAARARDLPAAPSVALVRLTDLGENAAASLFLTLRALSYDDQPGISLPYKALNYPRLIHWFDTALALDPRNRLPPFAASLLYAAVPDPAKVRLMLAFTHQAYLADPERRWPWLAYAALAAHHSLHDPKLALRYARDLDRARNAPPWVREMPVLLLSNLGHTRQAEILLGGLVASGVLSNPAEIAWMKNRLEHPLAVAPPDW